MHKQAISLPMSILIVALITITAAVILFSFTFKASGQARQSVKEQSKTPSDAMACFEGPVPSLKPQTLMICEQDTDINIAEGECTYCTDQLADFDGDTPCLFVRNPARPTDMAAPITQVNVRLDSSGSSSSCLEPMEFALTAPSFELFKPKEELDCEWPTSYDDKDTCGVFTATYLYDPGKIFEPSVEVNGLRSAYESKARANIFIPYSDFRVEFRNGITPDANGFSTRAEFILWVGYGSESDNTPVRDLSDDDLPYNDDFEIKDGEQDITSTCHFIYNAANKQNGIYKINCPAEPDKPHNFRVKLSHGVSGAKQYAISKSACVLDATKNRMTCPADVWSDGLTVTEQSSHSDGSKGVRAYAKIMSDKAGTYKYTIDWGDGTETKDNTGTFGVQTTNDHEYAPAPPGPTLQRRITLTVLGNNNLGAYSVVMGEIPIKPAPVHEVKVWYKPKYAPGDVPKVCYSVQFYYTAPGIPWHGRLELGDNIHGSEISGVTPSFQSDCLPRRGTTDSASLAFTYGGVTTNYVP